MKKATLFLLGAILLPQIQAATISIVPPATVSGYPNSTVTWDFTIHNDTDFWVMLTSAEFPPGGILGAFENFAETFPVLTPHTSQSGTAGFTINAGASPGSSASGAIQVYYFEYNVDINNWTGDNPPDPVGAEQVTSANVTVDVADVPEPATWLLLLLAGVALLLLGGGRKLAA